MIAETHARNPYTRLIPDAVPDVYDFERSRIVALVWRWTNVADELAQVEAAVAGGERELKALRRKYKMATDDEERHALKVAAAQVPGQRQLEAARARLVEVEVLLDRVAAGERVWETVESLIELAG